MDVALGRKVRLEERRLADARVPDKDDKLGRRLVVELAAAAREKRRRARRVERRCVVGRRQRGLGVLVESRKRMKRDVQEWSCERGSQPERANAGGVGRSRKNCSGVKNLRPQLSANSARQRA